MAEQHAVLAASASHRWLECTPSPRQEEQFPVEESAYAAEGTLAHALSNIGIRRQLNLISTQQAMIEAAEMLKDPMYGAEMEGYVDDFVTYIIEQYNQALVKTSDAIILTERRVDFSKWVPEGFGTGDVIIIADKALNIIDLKYGKGVTVEADDNSQLMLYALGAVDEFRMLYDIETVRMTIYQPRIDNISTFEMPVEDLINWADTYVKPRAELAFKGEGEFVAGHHCKFCRARHLCKTRADANLAIAKFNFRPSNLLSDAEIVDILNRAELFESWIKDIKEYAFDQAVNHGKHWEGFKVVSGRSNRKYGDEKAIEKVLTGAGYTDEEIHEKELKGITAMEKFLGKKKFNELLNPYIIKPEGAPALVPESDERPERNSAEAAKKVFGEAGQVD